MYLLVAVTPNAMSNQQHAHTYPWLKNESNGISKYCFYAIWQSNALIRLLDKRSKWTLTGKSRMGLYSTNIFKKSKGQHVYEDENEKQICLTFLSY